MQALLRASRRLDNIRIAIAVPDNLPTLLGAVECLPSLGLIRNQVERLHTAAHSIVNSAGVLNVPLNAATVIRAGQPATQEQQLMALKLGLMEQNAVHREANRLLSPFSSILLPSRHCGLLPEHNDPDSNADGAAENSNEWQADSVRRKRKKKMNKHKHSKRRKLTRHKR